jgi:hypothetical protein
MTSREEGLVLSLVGISKVGLESRATDGLFGYMYINFNPYGSEWIGIKLNLIPFNFTSTHVD